MVILTILAVNSTNYCSSSGGSSSSSSSSSSSRRPPPPRAYTLLKMDYNGKGVGGWGGGGGSSVLRKLIREAATRGMCVLESIRIIALGVFGQ